jgi:hypothetical protein
MDWAQDIRHVAPRIDDRYQCDVPDMQVLHRTCHCCFPPYQKAFTEADSHTSFSRSFQQPAAGEHDRSFGVWATRFESARKRQRTNVPGRAGELDYCDVFHYCVRRDKAVSHKPLPSAVSEYLEFARMLTEQAPFAWKQVY